MKYWVHGAVFSVSLRFLGFVICDFWGLFLFLNCFALFFNSLQIPIHNSLYLEL